MTRAGRPHGDLGVVHPDRRDPLLHGDLRRGGDHRPGLLHGRPRTASPAARRRARVARRRGRRPTGTGSAAPRPAARRSPRSRTPRSSSAGRPRQPSTWPAAARPPRLRTRCAGAGRAAHHGCTRRAPWSGRRPPRRCVTVDRGDLQQRRGPHRTGQRDHRVVDLDKPKLPKSQSIRSFRRAAPNPITRDPGQIRGRLRSSDLVGVARRHHRLGARPLRDLFPRLGVAAGQVLLRCVQVVAIDSSRRMRPGSAGRCRTPGLRRTTCTSSCPEGTSLRPQPQHSARSTAPSVVGTGGAGEVQRRGLLGIRGAVALVEGW